MILTNKMIGKAAIYLRLSRDDGDKAESDSIHSQRELIHQFLSKYSGMKFIREYVDDGYSGTTFDRPAFIRMIEDLKKNQFDCLIVKDLSRLGRNYIETGRYIERIFPSMGLRLIAVNDNYDSLDKSSSDNEIVVPFKNLINDAYCRDVSLKIRSHLDVKRKDGQFIGSFAMYGYEKDPENKNHLLIDKYAADIVETIFDWRLEGCSALRIAQRLNELGIQPPYEYKRKNGLNYNSGFRSVDKAKWQVETINRILKNEMYTGTMVQGKSRKINYKVKKSMPVPEEDWIIVEGTHDAIISKEKFEAVQKLSTIDTRVAPSNDEVYALSGFIKCADCGQSMIRRSSNVSKYKYYYYHCSTYKNGNGCSPHLMNCNKVEKIVIDALKNHISLLDKVESLISGASNAALDRACVKMISKQEERLKKEIEHYGNLKAKLYSDMVDGLISKDEFTELNDRFSRSREQVEEALKGIRDIKANGGFAVLAHPAWSLNTADHILDLSELDAVEIYNTVSGFPTNPDRQDASVILDSVFNNGLFLPVLASDDTHWYLYECCCAATMIQTDDFTADGVLKAIKEGKSYATTGPLFKQVEITDGRIHVECSPCAGAVMLTNHPWIGGTCRVAGTEEQTRFDFEFSANTRFVRIMLLDQNGQKAWTNPVKLG